MEIAEKFASVCEFDGGEFVDVPLGENGTLSIVTLNAYFPGATDLQYRGDDFSPYRTVPVLNGEFYAPDGVWTGRKFCCVRSNGRGDKRKFDEAEISEPSEEINPGATCTDLMVMGLSYEMDETGLREFFSQFGNLVKVLINRDWSGNSKKLGFIRYEHYASQVRVLARRHFFIDQLVEVRIPKSIFKDGCYSITQQLFVGDLTECISESDLIQYFSRYGEIINVFIPKPCRGFGFITFKDAFVAEKLISKNHIVKGVHIYTSDGKINPRTETLG